METAVLPARDHLADHQYRHHNRPVPSLAVAAGANPRSRRKSGRSSPPRAMASFVSDAARFYFGASNSTAEKACGGFRGAAMSGAFSAGVSGGSFPISSFSNTAASPSISSPRSSSHGFHPSPQASLSQQHGSGQGRAGVLSKPSRESAGGSAFLEKAQGKKFLDKKNADAASDRHAERGVDKKSQDKKAFDISRSKSAKSNVEASKVGKAVEVVEKRDPERKVVADRKFTEREKVSSLKQDFQKVRSETKVSNQKNAGPLPTITILKRPQTKEAAAENLAIITGVPLTEICIKNGVATRQSGEPAVSPTLKGVNDDTLKNGCYAENAVNSTSGGLESSSKRAGVQRSKTVGPLVDGASAKPTGASHEVKKSESSHNNKTYSPRKETASFRQDAFGVSDKADMLQMGHVPHAREKSVESSQKHTRVKVLDRNGLHGSRELDRPSGRGGDSPVKESARILSNVSDRNGSLTAGHMVSSVSTTTTAHLLKGSGGNFTLIDPFQDFAFFGPRSPANERWAGPAYSNSPPPSSLPFPTFSLHKLRESSAGDLDALTSESGSFLESDESMSSGGSSSAPPSPSRDSSNLSMTEDQQQICPDVSFVTRDLRRMLNLNSSLNAHMTAIGVLEEVETLATQGLKRILQLE